MNNMRIVPGGWFFVFLLVSFTTGVLAQKLDTSSTLVVVPFSVAFENPDDESNYSKIFAEKTLTAIEQSKRFQTIDRTDLQTIEEEIARWEGTGKHQYKPKKQTLTDEAIYWYGQRLKADFVMTGTVASIEAPIDLITGLYRGNVSFTVKVMNIRTSKIYVTEDFDVGTGGLAKGYNSKRAAIDGALSNMTEKVKKFVDKYFPIYAKYLRTGELQKTEMKKAYVSAGSEIGFRLNQKLDVVLMTGDGMPPEDVGDAEVIAVQPDHSVVKISSVKKGLILETLPKKSEQLFFRSKAN